MDTDPSLPISIFTIGYGNRNFDEFIVLLKKYEISYIIDIRSSPYSKYNPDFTQNFLEINLKKNNFHYVYMGDTLGGRPDSPDCYTDGKVDYEKLREKEFFKKGINRLKKAWENKSRVVLLCSEIKPEECHRSKLIGESLHKIGIDVMHIDENGDQKKQKDVIDKLTNGQLIFMEIMGTHPSLKKSRKKYRPDEETNDNP